MTEELDVLQLVTGKLDKEAVPYMITGSVAANFYSLPRMTRDIDIVIQINLNDTDKMVETFKKDFYIDRESVDQALRKEGGMFNIIHTDTVIKIDFIIRKKTPYRELEFKRRRRTDFEGAPLSIVSLEDLILSKLFWAKDSLSEMRLNDVKQLLDVKGIDMPYVLQWVGSLGLRKIFKKARR